MRSMKRLWQRLRLAEPDARGASFEPIMEGHVRGALERLEAEGCLRRHFSMPPLSLPYFYQEVLEVACSEFSHEDLLRAHFLDVMPTLLAEQLACKRPFASDFFHRPLDWSRLPQLSAAVEAFCTLLRGHSVAPEEVWGFASLQDLKKRCSTLAEVMGHLCFGRCFPLLYAYPGDLDSYVKEIDAEQDYYLVFDRRFTHPLVHELSHFGRSRNALFPPILDESISAYLGFLAHRSIAFPRVDEDNGLMGASFFIQIGQAFVRAFGLKQTLRAHAGLESFESVLGSRAMNAITRIGWEQLRKTKGVSLLEGHREPGVWHKICCLLERGIPIESLGLSELQELDFSQIDSGPIQAMDRDIIEDGLASMCLNSSLSESSYRVWVEPTTETINLDLLACRMTREAVPECADHAPPSYIFPPAVAYLLRQHGVTQLTLRLADMEAIGEVAEHLLNGRTEGEFGGFSLRRKTDRT
jgi:hypothetical protein